MSKILAQGMITLTQLYEGVQVILTPTAVLIPCDSEENPKSNAYINASTNVKAFLGTMDITSGITLGELEYSDSTVKASKTGTKVSITTITTRTGYVDIPVSATINGETIDLGKHRFNFVKQIDGQPGIPGDPGFGYTLNIKGGTRGVAYAANGTNPEPKTSSQFSVELLKNGVKVSNPASILWTCGGNLSGSSSVATFTPVISSTYNSESSYVKVSVKEFAVSVAVEETIPIVCTKHADGLDWINEWNNQYVQVGTEKIITPKIFAGTKNNANELTGVAIGRDVLGGNANKVIGIVGYKKNTPVFSLDQDANFFVSSSGNAGDIKNGTNNAKGIYFDGNNLYVSGKVKISGGSTIGENNTSVEDVINNSNLGAQANNKIDNIQIGGVNILKNSHFNHGGDMWGGWNSENRTRVQEGYDGGWCAKTIGAFNDARNLSQRIYREKIELGGVYTATVWIKTENVVRGTTNPHLYLFGSFYDNNMKWKAEVALSPSIPEGTMEWTKYITTFQMRKTDDWSRFEISLYARDFTGTIWWDGIKIEKGNKATDWSPAPEDIDQQLTNIKTDLQTQVDGKIDTWSQETPDPASNWTTSDEKLKHKGDIWYKPTSKETYRYTGTSWERLYDKVAENATNIANQKRRVFVSTPTTPYDVGDLWINNEELYRCKTALSSGSYNSGHWVKAVKYTDDSVAQSAKNDLQAFKKLDEWLVINNELDTYFPFDNNLQTTGGINPNSGYSAYLTPQGKFGNCLSIQEDVVNLFAFNNISELNVRGNETALTTTKLTNEEVICKYIPPSSTGLVYRGKDIAVDTQRTYTLSGWMYVSENYNSTYTPAIRGELGFGKNMAYDMSKKGQWQFFSHTMKPSSGTARILLYPRTVSASVENAITGYVLYKNVQFTQTGAVHMFYNGTKPKDTISYEVSQPDISTMMAYKKHVLDSNFKHQALVKNGSTFTFYENGAATTNYVNKWRVYACEGITTPGTDGKNIDKYNKPLSTQLTTDLTGISYSWQATGYGHVYRTFLYCSQAKTVTLMINFDNAGCAYCNGVLAGQGGFKASGNACTFNLVKGWNCIELANVDADTGGALHYISSGSDGLFSDKTSHPEILYMTAELPIEMSNNKVAYFSRANCFVDEAVFLNKAITQEEAKTYVESGKRLTDPATIIDVPEPTNVTFSFS